MYPKHTAPNIPTSGHQAGLHQQVSTYLLVFRSLRPIQGTGNDYPLKNRNGVEPISSAPTTFEQTSRWNCKSNSGARAPSSGYSAHVMAPKVIISNDFMISRPVYASQGPVTRTPITRRAPISPTWNPSTRGLRYVWPRTVRDPDPAPRSPRATYQSRDAKSIIATSRV